MFTGIITHTAKIRSHAEKNKSLFLTIAKPASWKLTVGESVATNGVCLTVKKSSPKDYSVELMPETLSKTTFGKKIPDTVNLERSLRLSDRVSGHFVTGHIDAIGRIISLHNHGTSRTLSISYPKAYRSLLIPKGSITIDGVSLTIVSMTSSSFTVAILDYTLKATTLGEKAKNDSVNLEFDILAKYARTTAK
jgi:riboflavin synthase